MTINHVRHTTVIDWYRQMGCDLIPLYPFEAGNDHSKRPLDHGWTERSYSRDEIIDYMKRGHSIGWRLSMEFMVIDVDVKGEGPENDGREAYERLKADFEIDDTQTMKVWTDHGSQHIYFRVPDTASGIRRHLKEYGTRVEFLSLGQQVVTGGCQHFNGGYYNMDYEWIENGEFSILQRRGAPTIADCPPKLLEALTRERPKRLSIEALELPASEIRDLLFMLDVTEYRGQGGEAWRNIMFAVHHACRGSEEGLQLFLQWCLQDPMYRDHGDQIATRWRSCNADDRGRITAGSLIKWARLKSESLEDENDREPRLRLIRSIEATHDFEGFEIDLDTETDEQNRIIVRVATDELRMKTETEKAFKGATDMFKRGGRLVTVVRDDPPPMFEKTGTCQSRIVPIPESMLRVWLSDRVQFVGLPRKGAKQMEPVTAPPIVLRSIYEDPAHEPVDAIRSLATAPCMLIDGTILQHKGFNRQCGVYYEPEFEYPLVPLCPTREDALKAMDRLKEPLVDFPFQSDAHRSVILAAMLTLVCRDAFQGPIPLFGIDGNMAGVGKSLLARVCCIAMTGQELPSMACPPNDEEMEKRLTTIAMQDSPMRLIDNVPNNRPLEFPSLDQVLTAGVLEGRKLGRHETTGKLEVRTVLMVTGNNIQWSASSDTCRRTAYCRLECDDESPEARSGFTHGADNALTEWLREQHPQLVIDALTILSAYVTAGRPSVDVAPWGSFNAWSDMVRRPLIWLGEPDPCDTRNDMDESANLAKTEAERVLEALFAYFGCRRFTIKELLAVTPSGDEPYAEQIEAVMREIIDPNDRKNHREIGTSLGRFKGRWVCGLRLDNPRKGSQRYWQIERHAERDVMQ